jgi:tRNA pseudouridine55 synthase
VLALLPRFTGEIMQTPPAFSAIKVDGERAYDRARAGEILVMQPRRVVIEQLTLLRHGNDTSDFEMTCEKGTYVRALARDLAEALDTKGHVTRLHRAAVGAFADANAVSLEALEAASPEQRDALLLPVSAGLAGLPEVLMSPDQATAIRHGNPVLLTGAGAPLHLPDAWASCGGNAIAIGSVEFGQFKPRRVLV